MEATTNVDAIFERLDALIDSAPVHTNRFYDAWRTEPLSLADLQFMSDQYYYYIRTFPQILAGLSHRVDSEEVRLRLARTVVSELGECRAGKMHFQLFENVMRPLGVTFASVEKTKHIQESEALVQGLREIFLQGPTIAAVGGHYTIERVGLGMIHNLYEGVRRLPGVTIESMEYFYLHLFLEGDHVDWIKDAVRQHSGDPKAVEDLKYGALRVAELLASFWEGLYRHMFAPRSAQVAVQASV